MSHAEYIPIFNLNTGALAILSSQAAIDIDNHMLGRGKEDEEVQYLSKLLNDATQGDNPSTLLSDINMVLAYAISGRENFKAYWGGKDVGEVVLQTSLAAKDLRDLKALPITKQEALRDYCVRLSTEALSFHRQYS